MAETTTTDYPAALEIDYPDRELDRFTTLLRPLTVIPIAVILALLTPSSLRTDSHRIPLGVGAGICPATALMLLFRRKYPRWWSDWNVALVRFGLRIGAYCALLRDEYPSTDDEQAVHVRISYPDAPRELSPWLPLVKWLLALPHYVLLCCLGFAAFWCTVAAWFAILFTKRYPRGLFGFVVGVLRWWLRVAAYAFLLTTDRYPPFSLSP